MTQERNEVMVLEREYPENIINEEMENVKFKKQVFSRRGGVTKGVPLVIMYHPLLKFVQTFIPAT